MSECFKAGVSNLLKKHLLLYLLKFSSHGQMFLKKKRNIYSVAHPIISFE